MSRQHQDSYISDDNEDIDCPLCMEEMDLSDRNFKPCPCGYQVCRFCWNHIRKDLNGRCPACRRPYSEETIEFKPLTAEEWKMDQYRKNQRKQKDRERKEIDTINRKHLANIRVVQKNLVYVIGLSPKAANEELLQTLRGHDYFGQYGKIQKIVINKKNASHPNGSGSLGIYITYYRKEDAAKAIAAVDGSLNDGRILRASYGTTKYCSTYLRNQPCPNPNCMYLHEPGEEADSFMREDLSTFQYTAKSNQIPSPKDLNTSSMPSRSLKITETISSNELYSSNEHEGSALPPTVSWATKNPPSQAPLLQKPLTQLNKPSTNGTSQKILSPPPKHVSTTTSPITSLLKTDTTVFLDKILENLCTGHFKFIFSSTILSSEDLQAAQTMLPLFTFNPENFKKSEEETRLQERNSESKNANFRLSSWSHSSSPTMTEENVYKRQVSRHDLYNEEGSNRFIQETRRNTQKYHQGLAPASLSPGINSAPILYSRNTIPLTNDTNFGAVNAEIVAKTSTPPGIYTQGMYPHNYIKKESDTRFISPSHEYLNNLGRQSVSLGSLHHDQGIHTFQTGVTNTKTINSSS
ncbi:hypothetical protein PNEG_02072 [Pneumocystis murina B123]|uniref:RING-type domain-containing protein n=1 Tax=Pneumocystis murina (strain B123) TaxID=1069680 RepID=M7PGA7_PNEMU|nr:hypothetical protein PNEG_02072 [Pneumocystis murina B123]EMR09484.1 hypothetical protein PNEG_02072 [Pneumocystis murina B123]